MDLTINPTTGRPHAYEAAVRLGTVGELFVVALHRGRVDGTAPVYLLARVDDELHYVSTLSESGGVVTDWFTDVGEARAYTKHGAKVVHLDSTDGVPMASVIGLPRDAF